MSEGTRGPRIAAAISLLLGLLIFDAQRLASARSDVAYIDIGQFHYDSEIAYWTFLSVLGLAVVGYLASLVRLRVLELPAEHQPPPRLVIWAEGFGNACFAAATVVVLIGSLFAFSLAALLRVAAAKGWISGAVELAATYGVYVLIGVALVGLGHAATTVASRFNAEDRRRVLDHLRQAGEMMITMADLSLSRGALEQSINYAQKSLLMGLGGLTVSRGFTGGTLKEMTAALSAAGTVSPELLRQIKEAHEQLVGARGKPGDLGTVSAAVRAAIEVAMASFRLFR